MNSENLDISMQNCAEKIQENMSRFMHSAIQQHKKCKQKKKQKNHANKKGMKTPRSCFTDKISSINIWHHRVDLNLQLHRRHN